MLMAVHALLPGYTCLVLVALTAREPCSGCARSTGFAVCARCDGETSVYAKDWFMLVVDPHFVPVLRRDIHLDAQAIVPHDNTIRCSN